MIRWKFQNNWKNDSCSVHYYEIQRIFSKSNLWMAIDLVFQHLIFHENYPPFVQYIIVSSQLWLCKFCTISSNLDIAMVFIRTLLIWLKRRHSSKSKLNSSSSIYGFDKFFYSINSNQCNQLNQSKFLYVGISPILFILVMK